MTSFLAAIGAIVVVIPALIGLVFLGAIWRTWWLYPTWAWFIVPLGAPQISFWHFMALMLLIGVLTHQTDTKKDERKTEWTTMAVVSLCFPVLTWAVLWGIHQINL